MVNIDRKRNIHPAQGARSALPPEARRWGRRLLGLPGVKHLRPWAKRAAAVAEIPGVPEVKGQSWSVEVAHCSTISVMSANLCHDWPRFRRMDERLEVFAGLVEESDADILLLQEVARKPGLHVDQWLAERLRMGHVYSRANGHSQIGFEEGLAIFSRFPLRSPSLVQLGKGRNPFVRRMAISALVESPIGDLRAFSVHLGLRSHSNFKQMAHLQRIIRQVSTLSPALVGGDFNSPETSLQIQHAKSIWKDTFREIHPHGDGHTHTLRWPWGGVIRRHRLDYIFLNSKSLDWQILDAHHLSVPGKEHSDHHAVLTRLSLVSSHQA